MLIPVFEDFSVETIATDVKGEYDSPEWVSIQLNTEDVISTKGQNFLEEEGYDLEDETIEIETNRYDLQFKKDGLVFALYLYYDDKNQLVAVDSVAVNEEYKWKIDVQEIPFFSFLKK